MEKNPLVSICITFFNGEKFLPRALESALHQTYRNIEVVLLDDMSSDRSREIIMDYVARDSRVKYFKNKERTGTLKSLVKTVKLARGKFVYWPGVDDWLSRDFVERGVRHFEENPEIAAVAPNLLTLEEKDGRFGYLNETMFKPGIYAAEWFVRRRYRDGKLLFGQFVFLRKEDMLQVLDYFVKTYCDDQNLPKEFRKFSERIFGIDTISFVEVLSRYKSFYMDSEINFVKILHPDNVSFNFKFDSIPEFLRFNYYTLLYYEPVYKTMWPNFNRNMKIYFGGDTLATVFIESLRHYFRPSFLKIKESKEYLSKYFKTFSVAEIISSILFVAPRIFGRAGNLVYRKIKGEKSEKRTLEIFTSKNFLTTGGYFEMPNG